MRHGDAPGAKDGAEGYSGVIGGGHIVACAGVAAEAPYAMGGAPQDVALAAAFIAALAA